MSEQLLGIVVTGEKVNCVHIENKDGSLSLINQFTWSLQRGDKPDAYCRIFERIKDYVSENNIEKAIIKASSVGRERAKLGHLHSAELRGIVCVAVRFGGAEVKLVQKGTISRTFGNRKADEYIQDDSFWENRISGDIAKTRREAAFLVVSNVEG